MYGHQPVLIFIFHVGGERCLSFDYAISNTDARNPDLTTLTVRIISDSHGMTSHVFDTDTENEWVHFKIDLHSVDNMKPFLKFFFITLTKTK